MHTGSYRISFVSLILVFVLCFVFRLTRSPLSAVGAVVSAAADVAGEAFDVGGAADVAGGASADSADGAAVDVADGASAAGGSETESGDPSLVETEMGLEIPASLTDGLAKDTPVGEAADMTMAECKKLIAGMYKANSPRALWARHQSVSATFRLFDEKAQRWEEYSTFYADPMTYYSDDWTPGFEELRLLIYGGDACVEDYTSSIRFVSFLNASGVPYRDMKSDPVTLDPETLDEYLLAVYRTPDATYLVTQLTTPTILGLGLEEAEEGAFYSCIYRLDPDSDDLTGIQIALHETDGTVKNVRNAAYSYDRGMTPFVEAGYTGLRKHLEADAVWAPEDLREVRVTLDPGTDRERARLLTALKGDPVSITLPDGYALYEDEELTVPWVDNGDYVSDLYLWAGKSEE